MSSPKPPLLLRPCVVWSPTELHMKRLKLWKRAQIWFSPLHGFARGRRDRSGGFLDLFRAETVEVESSSSGYRSAWRETWPADSACPGEIHNSGEVHRGFYGSRSPTSACGCRRSGFNWPGEIGMTRC
ncbi:unnamed protein product [Brassica oleracea var. botrytis]